MRLTTVLLIASLMQVSAAGLAQKITLSKTNAPLKTVLKELRLQSGFDFIATEALLEKSKSVSLKVKDMELEDVLESIFDEQPLTYTIENKTVTLKAKEPSFLDNLVARFTDIDVHGRVVDETGNPLPNASIQVKGKAKVYNSNDKGEFSIPDVADDGILVIRYVGFKMLEIALKDAVMPLEIKLNVATGELEEVKVVFNTGYQELNKERSTGSFVQIDNELFNRAVGSTVLDRIYNITSGLIFNPTPTSTRGPDPNNIVIRGVSTIEANNSALVVVDNFPYEGDLKSLNPNDIESITVLKDAAAASIWGVRAGNGVIVITTKKGRFNQPTSIGFNSNVTVGQKPDLFYIPYIPSKDMIEFEKQQYGAGIFNEYDDLYPSINNFPIIPQSIEILLAARKKNESTVGYNALNDPAVNAQLDELSKYDIRNDIQKYLLKNSLNQQYALNLSGGGSTFNYYSSIGYDKSTNDNIEDRNSRLSLNFNNTWRPIKSLEISSSIVHTRMNNKSPGMSVIYDELLSNYSPYTRLVDENGMALAIPKSFRMAYIDTARYPGLLDWHYRPLEDYKYTDNQNQQYDTRLSAILKYNIRPWVKAEFQYQNQTSQSNGRNYSSQESFTVRDGINKFTNKDATGKLTYPWPLGDVIGLSNNIFKAWNIRGSLNFNQQFGQHHISALVGMELRETTSESNFSTLYGFDPQTYTSKSVDVVNVFPTRPIGANRIPRNTGDPGENLTRNGSVYGNAAYDFNGKYLATLSGRIDQSNFFGVKANLRRVPLWHVGLAWNLHLEDFYHISWLSTLKLRSSYGYTGNANSGASSYATFINRTGSEGVPIRNVIWGNLLTVNNPQLRWERVKIIDLGIDFSIKNNRINGSIDFYQKDGIDLLGPIIPDPTSGVVSYTGNQASINIKGIDFILNTINVKKKSFMWTTKLLASFNKDKVTAYKGIKPRGVSLAGDVSSPIVGYSLSRILSYRWAGLDPLNGDPRFYLADTISSFGNVTQVKEEDLRYSGQRNPKFFGSILNQINYKQFSASANVTYKFGHYFRRSSIDYNYINPLFLSSPNGHFDYTLRWKKPGDELFTNVPSLPLTSNPNRENVYLNSDFLVEKADHVRLQDIRLDYRFDKNTFKKSPFKNVSLYMFVSNLGIIWKANKHGLDPDAYAFTQLPNSKTIAFGLNANF
ncbi:MAG TPA: SusC/RagA family TonB-linked outer membrane protein [Pedobacter sp.]|uniref:SusC/RagA family TonB-linked outer membrane protein n=1 Tax=Pedobacter sp. TaxID=1411316 RepID=UPI002D188C79|nr:SusC/RagA family TonB-linked outer membrane protein [Pedobacter sp.]HMI01689.1 SusC/RagA family TonB-linked outer membrane protein [Pedobacter sp.]